jgi:hypothetical protein
MALQCYTGPLMNKPAQGLLNYPRLVAAPFFYKRTDRNIPSLQVSLAAIHPCCCEMTATTDDK